MYIMNGILELKAEVSCADSAFQKLHISHISICQVVKGAC